MEFLKTWKALNDACMNKSINDFYSIFKHHVLTSEDPSLILEFIEDLHLKYYDFIQYKEGVYFIASFFGGNYIEVFHDEKGIEIHIQKFRNTPEYVTSIAF